ncbi:MAG: hypothetical protein JO257_07635 [Deltaproteobacteria bacterium]|nr:hypothetical protein [Deltaproteobacteria bacterium]
MMRFLLGLSLLAACSSNHATGPASAGPDAGPGGNGGGGDSGTVIGDAAVGPVDAVDAAPDAYVDRGVEQDYDDLATTLAGAMRAQEVLAMQDGVNAAYNGGTLPNFTSPQAGELTGQRGSVSYDYMFHCEDQAAHDNFTCGPASNHIHWMATINGPVMIDALSFSEFKLTTKWTIYEIYLNKPQVEGYDHLLLDSNLSTDGTRFQLTVDGNPFGHVRLDPQPTLPFQGDVTYAISAKRTRATANPTVRTYTVAATVTYTGPGAATLVLDGTHTYDIDMSTGAVTRM